MAHRSSKGPWLICGARNCALTIADVMRDACSEVLSMFDDGAPEHRSDAGLSTFEQAWDRFRMQRQPISMCIGYRDLAARWRAWEHVQSLGWPSPSLIHPEAYVAATAQVGRDAIVMARSIVDKDGTHRSRRRAVAGRLHQSRQRNRAQHLCVARSNRLRLRPGRRARLRRGRRINDSMRKFIAEQTIKHMIASGSYIKGARVNVLGLTFKENFGDLRNSKVIDISNELKSYGVEVFVTDPQTDAGYRVWRL